MEIGNDKKDKAPKGSIGKESVFYLKNLSEEEKKLLREQITINLLFLQEEEIKLEDFKDLYKSRTKPVENKNDLYLGYLKNGFRETNIMAYKVPDYKEGVMNYVNTEGDIVSSRPLKSEERQTNIFDLPIK